MSLCAFPCCSPAKGPIARASEVISARHGAQTDTALSPGRTRGWKESEQMRVFQKSRTALNRDSIFIYPLKKIHEDAKSKNKRDHGNERVKSVLREEVAGDIELRGCVLKWQF